jgi:AcrR family transcriptional regulator
LRAIAAEAGIAESQIVRNFASKADLFRQAVVEPIAAYLNSYYADWAGHQDQPYSAEQTTRLFVAGLYDLFREHRKLLLALISSNAFEPELADQTDMGLAPALKQVEEIQAFEIERGGYRVGPITIRTVVGMVLSMSVLEQVIYSPGEVPPTREQVIDELTALSLHGIVRPPSRE